MNTDDWWQHSAACYDSPTPDMWFPESGEWRAPRKVCNACPVRTACLSSAMKLETDPEHVRSGMWGGLTPIERHRLAEGKTK